MKQLEAENHISVCVWFCAILKKREVESNADLLVGGLLGGCPSAAQLLRGAVHLYISTQPVQMSWISLKR